MSLLLAPSEWPTSGPWESVIKWFSDGVGGKIAIAIILLTICLKLVMLPLDFWQRYNTRKMTQAQVLMKDELDAIKSKYQDQNVVNQKTMELYKKHNFKPTSGCLPMLVYMIVTWVVFFTLFSALGNISRTKINYEYAQLQETYVAAYQPTYDAKYQEIVDAGVYPTEDYGTLEEYADAEAQKEALKVSQHEVVVKYDQIRQGFLSIKTLWRPDNWSSVFPNYSEFINNTGTQFKLASVKDADNNIVNKYVVKLSSGDGEIKPYISLDGKIYVTDATVASLEIKGVVYDQSQFAVVTPEGEQTIEQATGIAAKKAFKADFETITNGINNKYKGTWNGYLGLIVLTAVITFLSQFLSSLGIKTRDKKGNQISGVKPNPVMGIVLAGIMIFFTISYTSMFALYIMTSNILSVGFSICINLVLNKIESVKLKKQNDKITPDYVRK